MFAELQRQLSVKKVFKVFYVMLHLPNSSTALGNITTIARFNV
jgi:hypothetical protein